MGEATLSAKERAEKIQLSLDPNIPSFVRIMHPSHVSRGFWMGIPMRFSMNFMSKSDLLMTFSDEEGREYEIYYLAKRSGLSGGWQGFVKAHSLREGDALVFQLVNLDKFKVYIARSQGILLRHLAVMILQFVLNSNAGEHLKQEKKRATKRLRVLSAVIEDNSENLPLKFEDNYSFESFTRILNNLVGNELPEDVKDKYYKICCTQNSFLHINLGHGHSCNFVAGIIKETVKIVDGVRSCKLGDTFNCEMPVWRKKLEELETLGMNLGFLIPKLDEIQKMSE
ncbi:hypothetical protein MKX03_025281 [Papaver bracteatum]|nr:hypothetical protein MKX03_025281 [Papaver bracteatum]